MSDFIHGSELSIFSNPWPNRGIDRVQCIDYRPVSQIRDNTVIEFNVPGSGNLYLDLHNTKLHVKLQIVKENGQLIDDSDSVGLVAVPLHSLFSQVDLLLENELVTGACTDYPFKAYLEKLLYGSSDHPQALSELHILDGSTAFNESSHMDRADTAATSGVNRGFVHRAKYTELGRVVDLEGKIHTDIAQQDKYILSSVGLKLRLYPTTDAFRLLCAGPHTYKTHIVDIYLKVCKISLDPEVILSHNVILQDQPAIYPFYKSDLRSFTVASGLHSVQIDDPWNGTVPLKAYVFLVDALAYNGDFSRNPFNFQHRDIRAATLYVDNVSFPHHPLVTDFARRDCITAFNSLIETAGRNYVGDTFDINPQKFTDGFTILAFNLQPNSTNSLDSWAKARTGHMRLELKFGTPIPEPLNVFLYATTAHVMHIDKARNVTISSQ